MRVCSSITYGPSLIKDNSELAGLTNLDLVVGSPEYFSAKRKNFWRTHHIGLQEFDTAPVLGSPAWFAARHHFHHLDLQELDTPLVGSPEYFAARRNNFWATHHIGLQELMSGFLGTPDSMRV